MLAACHSGRDTSLVGVSKKPGGARSASAASVHARETDYQKLLKSLSAPRGAQAGAAAPVASTANLQVGDWSEVRGQAEAALRWPSHPLEPKERLAFASAFVSRVAALGGQNEGDCGGRLCILYEQLCQSGSLLSPCTNDAVYSGVAAAADLQSLAAASREIVLLVLSGHVASLAAPRGSALDLAKELADGFPSALLQAVEAGPLVTLPAMVRTFRSVGCCAGELWTDKVPPADFGNFGPHSIRGSISEGMAAAASPLMLAQTNLTALENCSEPRFEFGKVVEELTEFLSTRRSAASTTSPQALSAYACGVGQVHNLLDLLWSFREPVVVDGVSNPVVSLTAAHKHFIITVNSAVPDDVVKASIVAALSPLREKVTLHVVGLGVQGLLRDPMLSFCRIVQSGRSGLEWQVKEHKDWSGLLAWLHASAGNEPEPPQLISTQRQIEIEVRRRCAEAGGVVWASLFVPEPCEQLRRWTSILEDVGPE